MAVEYSGRTTITKPSREEIEFTGAISPGYTPLGSFSCSFLTYLDTISSVERDFVGPTYFSIISHKNGGGSTNAIRFKCGQFPYGEWRADNAINIASWYRILITYDLYAPVIYVNGVSKAVTQETLFLGEIDTGPLAGNIGLVADGHGSFDGKLQDYRIYDRILTAQEAVIEADGRNLKAILGGLVFWAPLIGAGNSQVFDGLALTTSNVLRDIIGGEMGVPYGSPIGRASTIQSIGGG